MAVFRGVQLRQSTVKSRLVLFRHGSAARRAGTVKLSCVESWLGKVKHNEVATMGRGGEVS